MLGLCPTIVKLRRERHDGRTRTLTDLCDAWVRDCLKAKRLDCQTVAILSRRRSGQRIIQRNKKAPVNSPIPPPKPKGSWGQGSREGLLTFRTGSKRTEFRHHRPAKEIGRNVSEQKAVVGFEWRTACLDANP